MNLTLSYKPPKLTPPIPLLISTEEELLQMENEIIINGYFAIDFETTSLEWYKPKERAVYLSITSGNKTWVIKCE